MIRRCTNGDRDQIRAVINDGARAYRGVVPPDCLPEPYFSREDLEHAMASGVSFWGYEQDGALAGVMGLQEVQDVALIRHAYVRGDAQRRGIGAQLLARLLAETERRILIGTWADAGWAIRFYQRHGFTLVSHDEKNRLLERYWSVPERQRETSVVLESGPRTC